MKKLISFIATGIIALLASQANAAVLGTASNGSNFLTSFTTQQLVPLGNGFNYMWFYVPSSGSVSISYNAECNVRGTYSGAWMGLEVLVDGIVRTPSSTSKAFCTSSPGNIYNWASNVSNVTPYLFAGWHYVQVRAGVIGSGTGWLGDSNLTVMQ